MVTDIPCDNQEQPQKTIEAVVLSDGKAGHYNQSLGIVERLPACHLQRIEVRFRSKWQDNLLRVMMCLLGGLSLPHGLIKQLLRLSLAPEAFVEIIAVGHADLILSTGSSVAAPNLLLARLLNAKTVTCDRPSPVGTRYFDLAILPKMHWPRHDAKNVCKTVGFPNRIRPQQINQRRHLLERHLRLTPQLRIGVLIGGEDRYDTISEPTADRFMDVLLRVATTRSCQILVTTSRRTPAAVSDLIRKRLSNPEICPLLVLAGQESPIANSVEAIFALSDIILVTEDSLAMVCEAASSGRRVIIVEIDHKTRRRPKRHRVYAQIMRDTSVRQCRIEDLDRCSEQTLSDQTPIRPLSDTQIAVDAIMRLVK